MSFIGLVGFPSFITQVINSFDNVWNEQIPSVSYFGLVGSLVFSSIVENVKGKRRKRITKCDALPSSSSSIKGNE